MKIPKFIVKINKTSIYFFYLSNLALEGKKFWVRKQYNKKFLASTGKLNTLEKESLRLFANTILKLEEEPNPINLIDIFYQPNPWLNLHKCTTISQYKKIHQVFLIFKNRWHYFWKTELKQEALIGKNTLESNIQFQESLIKEKIESLSILYNKTKLPKTIPVFFIPLPKDIQGIGGKYIRSIQGISIEASSNNTKKERILEIILHELIHLCFENDHYWKMLSIAEQQLPTLIRKKLLILFEIPSVQFGLKEIIATSTTIKLSSANKTKSSYQQMLIYISQQLKPLIEQYKKDKKQIDLPFIDKVITIWLKIISNKKDKKRL